jgi:hypothetical protein
VAWALILEGLLVDVGVNWNRVTHLRFGIVEVETSLSCYSRSIGCYICSTSGCGIGEA